jgi:hypothetical protein
VTLPSSVDQEDPLVLFVFSLLPLSLLYLHHALLFWLLNLASVASAHQNNLHAGKQQGLLLELSSFCKLAKTHLLQGNS